MKPNCPKCGQPGDLYDSDGVWWVCHCGGTRTHFCVPLDEAAKYAAHWGGVSRANATERQGKSQ